MLWDKVFNGGLEFAGGVVAGNRDHGGRWGLCNNSAGDVKINDGLRAPAEAVDDSGNITFGYRLYIKLASGETISVPCMQINGHTVTLNADGTTEETMEFSSYITPFVGDASDVTRITSA
jgi:hypothetical protein